VRKHLLFAWVVDCKSCHVLYKFMWREQYLLLATCDRCTCRFSLTMYSLVSRLVMGYNLTYTWIIRSRAGLTIFLKLIFKTHAYRYIAVTHYLEMWFCKRNNHTLESVHEKQSFTVYQIKKKAASYPAEWNSQLIPLQTPGIKRSHDIAQEMSMKN